MHRDIKPFNVLINHEIKELRLVDFGLSEYYFPSKENNTKVASTYYKAPELYFSNTQYDYRVDCWAAGMILAGMVHIFWYKIFKKTPFLMGNDQIDQILKLTKLLGAA
jgi:casein kinase II subunit alpha